MLSVAKILLLFQETATINNNLFFYENIDKRGGYKGIIFLLNGKKYGSNIIARTVLKYLSNIESGTNDPELLVPLEEEMSQGMSREEKIAQLKDIYSQMD